MLMGLGSIGKKIGKVAKTAGSAYLNYKTGGLAGAALGGMGSGMGGAGGTKPYTKHLTHGIRWKVEDAKAAGLHPLFAMGASVGSPVMQATGQDQTGSMIGGALEGMAQHQAQQSAAARQAPIEAAAVRAQNASAQRDEAEAALLNSQRMRLTQDLQNRPAQAAAALALARRDPDAVAAARAAGAERDPARPLETRSAAGRLAVTPGRSTMQEIEEEHGAIAAEGQLFLNFLNDLGRKFGKSIHDNIRAKKLGAGEAGRKWYGR